MRKTSASLSQPHPPWLRPPHPRPHDIFKTQKQGGGRRDETRERITIFPSLKEIAAMTFIIPWMALASVLTAIVGSGVVVAGGGGRVEMGGDRKSNTNNRESNVILILTWFIAVLHCWKMK